MPRRANSGVKPASIIGALVAVALIGALGWMMFGKAKDPFAATDDLEVDEFLTNARSLMGNEYKVQGRVHEQLKWTPDSGRLFSILVDTPTGESPIPVLVPGRFNDQNFQVGQEFLFKITVGRNGSLQAEEIQKI